VPARVCAGARAGVAACVVCPVPVLGDMGFSSASSMSGSLLLERVCGRAQTECDVCVVRWTEAALSGPYWQSVQRERSSDVVASLPVGPGLVRASEAGCSRRAAMP
jgi:hypothetical protein